MDQICKRNFDLVKNVNKNESLSCLFQVLFTAICDFCRFVLNLIVLAEAELFLTFSYFGPKIGARCSYKIVLINKKLVAYQDWPTWHPITIRQRSLLFPEAREGCSVHWSRSIPEVFTTTTTEPIVDTCCIYHRVI